MTFEEAVESLRLKFQSGNPIEVERATILRKEWEALLPVIVEAYMAFKREQIDDKRRT